MRILRSIAFVVLSASCAPSPSSQPSQPAPPRAAEATPAPASSAAEQRADALLEDMRRREAAFAKAERELPAAPRPPSAYVLPAPQRQQVQPGVAPVTPSSEAAPTAPVTNDPRSTELYWKDRMRALQARLDADRNTLAGARASEADLSRYVSPDGSMTRTVADNMFKTRTDVARLIAAVASDQIEITNLQEEARRAGIPPGWLRP